MLRPAMSQIVKKDESAYEFVIEVARRAREIVNEAVIPKTESIVRSNTGRDSQPVFLVSGSRKGV